MEKLVKGSTKFKSIVPGLVSLDSCIKKIKGSHLLQNLYFYNGCEVRERFHYKLCVDNHILIPRTYDFRSEYFFKKDNFWYYNKTLFGLNLKFKYDVLNKSFCCNKLMLMIPFRLGGLLPMAEYFQGLINLDLFLEGLINLRGFAFQYREKNYCFIAPGLNGKTSFLTDIIRRGGKYIAEDNLLIDFKSMEVYPTANARMARIYNRKTNRILENQLCRNNIVINKQKIDRLFLLQNSTSKEYLTKEKKLINFLILNSLYFLVGNLFIKSYLFEEGLMDKFLKRFSDIEKIDKFEFAQVRDYDFEGFLNFVIKKNNEK
jgi:hypothetical protein